MISRLLGMLIVRAESIALDTSSSPMIRSLRLTATTPRLLRELMCPPAMPTWAETILYPLLLSAFSTDSAIDSTVSSMLTTIPLRSPREGLIPTPTIWTSPSRSYSPTSVHTLVVPTSMAAVTLSFAISPPCCFAICLHPTLGRIGGTPPNPPAYIQLLGERGDTPG